MGKFLLTGYPGTGKSSVARELKRRGRAAYDTEAMMGYMHAESIVTGHRIPLPSPVPAGWFNFVGAYIWDINRVSKLIEQHDEIFICALADNQPEFYALFDHVYLLLADITTMQHRLEYRASTSYGKDRQELSDILKMHRHFEESLLNSGAISINAEKPLKQVVDEIIKLSSIN